MLSTVYIPKILKKSGKITQIFEIQTIGHSFLELDERRSEIGK